jgi:hypothetical protein
MILISRNQTPHPQNKVIQEKKTQIVNCVIKTKSTEQLLHINR